MATFLYRLAAACHRRRKAVLALWLALLIALGGLAAGFSGKTSDEFRVPGTEAQTALDRIAHTLPEYANASGQVVFAAPEGETLTTPERRTAIQAAAQAVGRAPGVAGVHEPFASEAVSKDGRIAFAQVVFDKKLRDLGQGPRDAVRDAAGPARKAGLQVEFGGDAYTPTVQVEGGEAIGVGVAVLVLLITFGSLVAAGMPMAGALVGVGVGMAALLALTGAFDIISTAPVLALMIGMAVGIDYALFIVSRHRQNLAEGMPPAEAAARANGTAGSAVVFAGATVVVALAGLAVAGVPFLTVMGLAAAGAVVVAMLVAVTLLPALLGFAGHSVNRLRVPGLRPPAAGSSGRTAAGERWGRLVVRHPVVVLLACLVGVGAMAVPVKDLRLGLPGGGSYARDTTARTAYDLVSEGFGQGFNGPLIAVVDVSRAPRPDQAVQLVTQRLAGLHGVVTPLPPSFDASRTVAAIPVIPAGGPDSKVTADLVSDIRAQRGKLREAGVDLKVSGTTAGNIDVSKKLGDALPPFLLVIAGISVVLLALAFRSVLVPVKAVVGFLLSVAAAMGAVVAVYQWGWLNEVIPVPRTGPVVSFLPILLIGVLFGLAMDYELFLVSRMKEERAHGAPPRAAVVSGFGNGARVVTAAALIMISVFGSFAFGHDPIVQPIGLALAVGVIVDAFVVRMALVPAVMALLGRAAWWFPSFLERVVPHVDMEGEKLAARLAAAPGRQDGEESAADAPSPLPERRGAGR
ncbi:MMPL family transporter [Streptomyces sp. NPDC049577]|uniref:MMPL family transporter n=1 Tax=Streptomyces sp. NPDC049577 TaxID=3155153 RepID=UPI00344385F4